MGAEAHVYSAAQLAQGVNLAADFSANPFGAAFKNVDEAVAAKQAYETKQIKEEFRSQDAQTHMDAVVARTEAQHAALATAMVTAFVPVSHTIRIEPQ